MLDYGGKVILATNFLMLMRRCMHKFIGIACPAPKHYCYE
jgi:hypothetical protein